VISETQTMAFTYSCTLVQLD